MSDAMTANWGAAQPAQTPVTSAPLDSTINTQADVNDDNGFDYAKPAPTLGNTEPAAPAMTEAPTDQIVFDQSLPENSGSSFDTPVISEDSTAPELNRPVLTTSDEPAAPEAPAITENTASFDQIRTRAQDKKKELEGQISELDEQITEIEALLDKIADVEKEQSSIMEEANALL